jgi:hypothetical protein
MIKELILQKGWAGKTVSRPETVARINPLIRELITLNHHYDAFVQTLPEGSFRSAIESVQKTARMDAGKMAETVFSCGGTAYSGTDLEPDSYAVSTDRSSALASLVDRESAFVELLKAESDTEHQMRTRAILSVVKGNAEARLKLLKESGR